jgi:predicted dehydrogenase
MKAVVIGAGRMGRRHVEVIRALGLELAGVCDLSPDALRATEEACGILPAQQFSDVDACLRSQRPECVIVATTAPTHCTYTCLAAERGARYILCEKPMGISLRECDRMIATCQARGVALAINHQMRYMEQYTRPKQIVESAEFGGLSSVTVLAGNFGLAMNGTHYFEMFRYLTGEIPAEVTAWLAKDAVPNPRGPQFEDRAGAVRLVNAKGQRFYMDVGPDQGHGMTVIYSGPYGQLVVDELAGTMRLTVREAQYRTLPTTRYGMPALTHEYRIQPADSTSPTKAVLHALVIGHDAPSGEEGRLAVAALVAAYLSDESGHQPVRLDATLPRDRQFPWA